MSPTTQSRIAAARAKATTNTRKQRVSQEEVESQEGQSSEVMLDTQYFSSEEAPDLEKTELAKALVRYHLGMESRPDLPDQLTPITISLSEFGDKSAVSKLIGAAPGLVGYDEPIPWHDEIRKDPGPSFYSTREIKPTPSSCSRSCKPSTKA